MKKRTVFWSAVAIVAAMWLACPSSIRPQAPAGGAAGAAASASSSSVQPGRDTSPMNAENYLELWHKASDKKEEKAFEQFHAVAATDYAKKIQSGEKFLIDYPRSELVRFVYPVLVVCYIQSGQLDKGMTTAKKDFEINPKDYRTMAVLSQTLARTYNAKAPNADEQLARADGYGKKALEGISSFAKPEEMTDEAFARAKDDIGAMAHGGIGLVLLQQKKYAEAIPDLQKATALNAFDQTNFYLLGVANQNSSHYAEAGTAFEKCASLPGNLEGTCRSAAVEAKKLVGR